MRPPTDRFSPAWPSRIRRLGMCSGGPRTSTPDVGPSSSRRLRPGLSCWRATSMTRVPFSTSRSPKALPETSCPGSTQASIRMQGRPAIDNSVRILDESSQESLAECIARPPISLKKIRYEPFNRSDSPKAISQTRQGAAYCFTPRTWSTSRKTCICSTHSTFSRSSPSISHRNDYS